MESYKHCHIHRKEEEGLVKLPEWRNVPTFTSQSLALWANSINAKGKKWGFLDLIVDKGATKKEKKMVSKKIKNRNNLRIKELSLQLRRIFFFDKQRHIFFKTTTLLQKNLPYSWPPNSLLQIQRLNIALTFWCNHNATKSRPERK